MTVTIDLPPDAEARLRQQAALRGDKLEDYLSALAQSWVRANGTFQPSQHSSDTRTPDQRAADWLSWVDGHSHITAVADDSRESFYEGRGE